MGWIWRWIRWRYRQSQCLVLVANDAVLHPTSLFGMRRWDRITWLKIFSDLHTTSYPCASSFSLYLLLLHRFGLQQISDSSAAADQVLWVKIGPENIEKTVDILVSVAIFVTYPQSHGLTDIYISRVNFQSFFLQPRKVTSVFDFFSTTACVSPATLVRKTLPVYSTTLLNAGMSSLFGMAWAGINVRAMQERKSGFLHSHISPCPFVG